MPRLLALALLLALAACDAGPASGDLDVGSFRGFDASIEADVGGGAFHDLTRVETDGLPALPLRFDLGAAELGSRTVSVSLPLGGRLAAGTYAIREGGAVANAWAWDRTAAPDVQELATGGSVTVTEVRQSGGYVDVVGSVEVAFPSGTITGTFRAIDTARPMPVSGCTATGCVDY